jgi:hypothetical protein
VIQADGFQPLGGQFTGSHFQVDIVPPDPADLNGDGAVGFEDLLIILGGWGPCPDPGDCPEDLDGDGSIGFGDLVLLLASWGSCP